MAFPLRKYFPMMHGSSIDEQDIAPDTILEGDIAPDAVTSSEIKDDAVIAGKLAADSIPNTAAIVKIFSPDAFDEAALLDVITDDSFTETAVDALFNADAIDAQDRLKAGSIISDRIGSKVIEDDRLASYLMKDVGRMASGLVDFNAEGDAASTITIGTVTYLEASGGDVTQGEWENGGTAAASATAFAAAVNGDTRAALVYAAVAVDTTVFLFAVAAGAAGNAVIGATGTDPDVLEDLIGGLDAVVKQVAHITHTVTAEEATQVQLLIPLPFNAAFFTWEVVTTAGADKVCTDLGTVVNLGGVVPAYFQLITNGGVHIAATDVVKLVVTN